MLDLISFLITYVVRVNVMILVKRYFNVTLLPNEINYIKYNFC